MKTLHGSILVVLVVALADVIVYVYDMYVVGHTNPVSYPAHISGAITGLLMGITVLKNLRSVTHSVCRKRHALHNEIRLDFDFPFRSCRWEQHERVIWAVSVCTFVVLMLVGIVWNVAVPSHFVGLPVPMPECITDKIL